MQTAQLKLGGVYAYKREGKFVRFRVDAITTRKASDGTKSIVDGIILEDRTGVRAPPSICIAPSDLHGPYEEHAELAKRAEEEKIARKAAEIAREKQAAKDRLALYAFVGEKPPSDASSYHQLFRMSFGTVDITTEGTRRVIEAARALQEAKAPVG